MVQDEDQAQTFGSWIRQQRKQRDLTQHELAELLHCSQITLRKMEAGTYRPSKDMILRVARTFNIPEPEHLALLQLARSTSAKDSSILLSSASPPPSSQIPHLPMPLTPLLGRAQEIHTLHDFLHNQGVRLLTLTGPGGVGKTRLALQFGAELRTTFANRIYFVALAPLHDPALVLPTIAQQLGLTETSEATLIQALTLQPTLLLLDNFEHLMPAAPLLTRLLAATTRLTLVVTSRARLQLYGEYELRVPPLELPSLGQLPALDELAQVPTVALFVARAQAAQTSFDLTAENAASVAEICARLDGLPLAIELAAARVRLLPPAILLQYLSSRLALLTNGPQDVDERHQALQQTIDWSYTLLAPPAQQLFAQLGVFAAGATLESIEAVCGESDTSDIMVLQGLTTLLDNSLLQQVEQPWHPLGGKTRFVMLETLREYALVQLGPAAAAVRQRHATYYLGLAEAAEPLLKSAEQERWVALLEAEHHNLRAALSWTLAENPDQALQLSATLGRFWYVHGHFTEGRQWLQTALNQHPSAPPVTRAKAFHGLGILAYAQGDFDAATLAYEAGLSLRRELGDTAGSLALLNNLGIIAWAHGEYRQAASFYAAGLDLWRELGDHWSLASALNNLGILAFDQADFERATAYYHEALSLRELIEDTWGRCITLNNLGRVAFYQKDYAQARILFERSLILAQELADERVQADIFEGQAWLHLAQEEVADARRLLVISTRIRYQHGEKHALARSLETFAALLHAEQQATQAIHMLGAAAALRELLGAPPSPVDQILLDAITSNIMAQISQADYVLALQAGSAMVLDELLSQVLATP